VVACCCDNKGAMLLQAKFDKTTAKPHDPIVVQFRCQNESSVKVKKVQIQFKSIITWKGCHGNHEKRVRHVLDSQVMDAAPFLELKKYRHHGRRGGAARLTSSSFHMDQQRDDGAFPYDVPWRQASIRVPGIVYDSYEGHAVHVRHIVTVKLLTKGCCINDVDATTTIRLFQSLPPNANTTPDDITTGMTQGSIRISSSSSSLVASPFPSAPSDVYNEYNVAVIATEVVSPSAPPSWKDDDPNFQPLGRPPPTGSSSTTSSSTPLTATATPILVGSTNESSPTTIMTTMVHAQVLPPNWNAHTAQVVEIPMAEAWVLENIWQVSETRDEQ
jgi:Arrestin (or S-antigen), C-terminal domain